MASFEFKTPDTSGLAYLRDRHTFGRRQDAVDTRLNYSYISKQHALIEWREPNWLLKDLSKNGIKLNGQRIPAQKSVLLSAGDVIDFAGMGEVTIQIQDLDPPTTMLINQQTPEQTIELIESRLLPSDDSPELAFYLCPDRGQWFAERVCEGIEAGPYKHGDLIKLGGEQWLFSMIANNKPSARKIDEQSSLNDVVFRFDIDSGGQPTDLSLFHNDTRFNLDKPPYQHLLLLLCHDRVNQGGAGWIDNHQLIKELRLSEEELNIQVFQARKQIAETLPFISGHLHLIERKRDAIRTGITNFEVYLNDIKQ